ncbi:NB-ARC domain-containing protein [Oscillatoria sp. FACHB-1406]|uniref:NB-ARC domain-containing protein n=1 Tax=Oscillatoria sp. FACHB-1406 TaxID=2692846 RepID=UPI001688022F|nr:NB-ARC domain-containing protein [Oscillatoria sp. FACHB-1406]MBD2580379.1 NB-ARC domain-containing protein [Oscillatoria sp. FACHB-1406]
MADTLKACKEGLEIVDRARRRKGWTKTRTPAWWDSAYTTQATLKRFWRGIAIQRENFIAICQAVGVSDWDAIATSLPSEDIKDLASPKSPLSPRIDWGEAPDLPYFYGRDLELQKLERWIIGDRCKLITLLGLGGIGKTSLAVTAVERFGERFEGVFWRSLLGTPPTLAIFEELIQFVSQGRERLATDNLQQAITQVIALLQRHRFLIVLDEVEAILPARSGEIPAGCEGYGDFLKRAGSDRHQSCLLLTSREKPGEVVAYEGQMLPIRSLQLSGLKSEDAIDLLATKGLSATENELKMLSHFYGGNPLALKTISTTIQELFNGNIAKFLHQNTLVLGDRLRGLLAQHLDRLSKAETTILFWLALDPEPLSLEQLSEYLVFPLSRSQILEILAALERRSLIDKITHEGEIAFTLQPLVMKYAIEKFVEGSVAELQSAIAERTLEPLELLDSHTPILHRTERAPKIPPSRVFSRLIEGLQAKLGCGKSKLKEQLSPLILLLDGRSPAAVGYLKVNLKAIFQALDDAIA